MKAFNELIKNFDKLREYLRDFTIYGYKQREDFSHKSPRTYDNEKRRIQSYLAPYISEHNTSKGKCMRINFDYLSVTANPLFEGYKTRSFTKNDIMLHFIIIDLLITYTRLSLNDIYDKLFSEYLSEFEDNKFLDQRTLRIKLSEYVVEGLIIEEKQGKVLYYLLAPNPLASLPDTTREHLFCALSFYQNISPLGMLGHFILEQNEQKYPYFAFSHLHFSHTVDELLVFELLMAIKDQKKVKLIHKEAHESIILPLKLVDNVEQGRRYLMGYHYKSRLYKFYRLDRLQGVLLLDEKDECFEQKLHIIDVLLDTTWGVALSGMDHPQKLEIWKLVLHIDEQKEQTLLTTIEKAHSEAVLQRIDRDTFHYTLSILDANEAVPWLRQFIGRIVSIECTNKIALNRFVKDISLMEAYYKEVE